MKLLKWGNTKFYFREKKVSLLFAEALSEPYVV